MKKWEYRVVENIADRLSYFKDELYLNAFGEDGWELVSYHQILSHQTLIFKRPLSNNADDKNKILIHSKEEEYSEDVSNDGG